MRQAASRLTDAVNVQQVLNVWRYQQMKAVIAIDSLKGSLSSIEAGQAIAKASKKRMPRQRWSSDRWQMAERGRLRRLYAA